jgi:hypothetical protein
MGANEEGTVRPDPREHDERTMELYIKLERAEYALSSHKDTIRRMAGGKIHYHGRRETWSISQAEAEFIVRDMAGDEDPYMPTWGMRPSEAVARLDKLIDAAQLIAGEIETLETIYSHYRWTRWFPCLNSGGHIHATLRGCSTVRWDTAMGWTPQLSGKSIEEAVAELGPALCSVCFPDAPVEHRSMTLGEVEKARTAGERQAAKDEREAKRAAKNLRPEEQFRDTWGWVTTVAGAIKVLRDEREYHYYFGRGPHPSHEVTALAAENAKRVLLAREAEHPGWGLDQAGIDQVVARADKKNRKEAGL